MKLLSALALTTLCALLACAPSTQTTVQSEPPLTPRADGKQVRLAVLSFNGASGRDLSDSLNTALFRTGRFILLERDSISGLQSEASIGQNPTVFEGADVVVTGAITAFEPNAGGITGGGLSISLPIIGGVQLSEKEAYIAADLRLVEVKTRRILNIVRVEGRSSSFGISGFGGAFVGPVFIGGNLSTYQNQPMGKAIAVMLEAAVHDIARGIPEVYYIDPNAPVAAKPSTPATQPTTTSAATSNSSSTTQTQAKVDAPHLLPENKLPFSDDFSSYPIGSALAVTQPSKYGLIYANNSDRFGSGFAQIDEDIQGKKLLQINNGSYITTGAENWQNYTASFDLSQKKHLDYIAPDDQFLILLNIDPNKKTSYLVSLGIHSAGLYQNDGQLTKEVSRRDNANYSFLDGTSSKVEITSKKGDIGIKIGGRTILEYRSDDPRYFQGGLGFGGRMTYSSPKDWFPFYLRNLKVEKLQ